MIKPIKFIPATKDYIWGGTTLKEKWGKTAETETIAECWELSSFPGSESIDAETGKSLTEIIAEHPEYFCGKATPGRFPILVKLIDAAGDLSVQVHPDDEYAREHEDGSQGKTEMWYIADAKPGASIYYGFSKSVSLKELQRRIKAGTVTSVLNRQPVKRGDSFFVPAGTVHALLSGVTVIEIQQNSNITYRVYDYNRLDKDGNPRPLHVEKALDVMNRRKYKPSAEIEKYLPLTAGAYVKTLAACKYFHTVEVKFSGTACYKLSPKSGFTTFTVANGGGEFSDGTKIQKGETWLIPCGCETCIKGTKLTLVLTNI